MRCLIIMLSVWLWTITAYAAELPRRGFLGATFYSNKAERSTPSVPFKASGARVKKIMPNTPAALANIQANDLITAINNQVIRNADEVGRMVSGFSGKKVRLTIIRDGKTITQNVLIKPFPNEINKHGKVLYQSVPVNNFRVRMIITQPHGKGPFPAVFFIQGLYCNSLDFAFSQTHPYKQLIDELTAKGYVTVRVEKSGVGDSEGPACREIGFHLEANLFQKGLISLRKLSFVDKNNIFILGHSMGGIIAPLIAPTFSKHLRGIAVFGTVVTSWLEYEVTNQRRQASLNVVPSAILEANLKNRGKFLSLLLSQKQKPLDIFKRDPRYKKYLIDDKYLHERHYSFFQELNGVDIASKWMKVTAPVLAIWGGADAISSKEDHQKIAAIVNRQHPGHAQFREAKEVDHNFSHSTTMSADPSAKKPYDPQVVNILLQWMEQLRKKNSKWPKKI